MLKILAQVFFRICQSWEWNKQWVLHTILCTQKAASLFNKLRLGGGGQCLKILLTPWFASKIKWKIEIKLNECFEVWYSTFIISNSLYTVHYIHYTMYHIDQISVHLKPNKRADLCEKSFCRLFLSSTLREWASCLKDKYSRIFVRNSPGEYIFGKSLSICLWQKK